MPTTKTEGKRFAIKCIALPLMITGIAIAAILQADTGLPRIDQEAPSSTRTATFAMG